MHYVYILISLKTNKFYIGETYDIQQRLVYHNDSSLNNNSTKVGIPWQLYLSIEVTDRAVARQIEKYIKNMKNRNYIIGLKENPHWVENLKNKFH